MTKFCESCGYQDSTLYYDKGQDKMLCSGCYAPPDLMDTCQPFERGHENPVDRVGTTAHVRDIKDRRWHPTEKRLFNYSNEKPKTYYFPGGKNA